MTEAATARRVYVLPQDLAQRIVAFQRVQGIESEAAAARRLFIEALALYDTPDELMARFRSAIAEGRTEMDAAREVLIGHPLLLSLEFGPRESVRPILRGARGPEEPAA